MNSRADSSTVTQEQIRAARHEGFKDSVAHLPAERRDRLTDAFLAQDGRRETNISEFYSRVVGDA